MTVKTILSEEVLQELDRLEEDGRMYQILALIEDYTKWGVDNGQFTKMDVYGDLEIALRVSYADNNIDDEEHYIHSERWLKRVEDRAAGCGTWFYRYSVCLMYLGRLEEALTYAEKGIVEEPSYPWGWLQVSGLRSHFGDQEGALAAVAEGLKLVPGDYEFRRRREEIQQGKTLAEMENHYIDEEQDKRLLELDPEDEESRQKRLSAEAILSGPRKSKPKKSGGWGWNQGPSTPR